MISIYYMKNKQAKKSEYDYPETYSLPSNPNAIDDIVATPINPAYGVCPNTRSDGATSSNTAYGVCPVLNDNQMTTTSAIYEDVRSVKQIHSTMLLDLLLHEHRSYTQFNQAVITIVMHNS